MRALRKHGAGLKALFGAEGVQGPVSAERIHSKIVAKQFPKVPLSAVQEVLVKQCKADAEQVMPRQFLRLMVQLAAFQAEKDAASPKASRAIVSPDTDGDVAPAGSAAETDAALFEATGERVVQQNVECALRAPAMDSGISSIVSVHGNLKWTTFRVLFRCVSRLHDCAVLVAPHLFVP